MIRPGRPRAAFATRTTLTITAAVLVAHGWLTVAISVARAEDSVEAIPLGATEDESEAVRPGQKPVQLEEIIVTATKREIPLRDVAASIDTFDGGALEAQGQLSLADFVETRPGVVMNSLSPGLLRISMRGISTDANSASSLPSPTGIFIGDVAFNDPFINNFQPDFSAFDLAGVELLKGPQGTLFGGSALAGAVRYVLRDPIMGQWQSRAFTQFLSASQGSQTLTAGAVVNMPLHRDSLALRVGYVSRNYPGINDIDRTPRQEDVDIGSGEQWRGILSWRPLDALGVKFTHLQQDFSTPNLTVTSDSPQRRELDKRVLAQPARHDFSLDSLELNYDFDTLRVVSLSSHNAKNGFLYADGTAAVYGPPADDFDPDNGVFQSVNIRSRSSAQELRLQSTAADGLKWLVGVFAYSHKVHFDILIDSIRHQQLFGSHAALGGLADGLATGMPALYQETSLLYAEADVSATEAALFFDLSGRIRERLELSAGARLYSTRVRGGFVRTGVLVRAGNNGMESSFEDNDISEAGVNPRLTAAFQLTQDISLYLQASRGFRFGGVQSVPSSTNEDVPPVYKSDSIWNYELGLRTNWLDNTLQLDSTVFYIDYQDPQISQTTSGIVRLTYTDNVGAAVSKGIEASLLWSTPLRGLTLELGGGLTDARTTEPFTAAGGVKVPGGVRMPGAAESQYAAAIGYVAPQLGSLRLGARLDYSYVGRGFADITQTHRINDYGTLNVGVTLTMPAWAFQPQLAVNVSNLLDVTAVKYATTTRPPNGENFDTFLLNPPRIFSVRLGFEF